MGDNGGQDLITPRNDITQRNCLLCRDIARLRSGQSITSERDTTRKEPLETCSDDRVRFMFMMRRHRTLCCNCDTLQGDVTCNKTQHLTTFGRTRAE